MCCAATCGCEYSAGWFAYRKRSSCHYCAVSFGAKCACKMVVVGGGSVLVQWRLTCGAMDCAGACTDDGCDAAAAAVAPGSSTTMPVCSLSDAARSNASRDLLCSTLQCQVCVQGASSQQWQCVGAAAFDTRGHELRWCLRRQRLRRHCCCGYSWQQYCGASVNKLASKCNGCGGPSHHLPLWLSPTMVVVVACEPWQDHLPAVAEVRLLEP